MWNRDFSKFIQLWWALSPSWRGVRTSDRYHCQALPMNFTTHLIQTKTSTSRKSYTRSKILFSRKKSIWITTSIGLSRVGCYPQTSAVIALSHTKTLQFNSRVQNLSKTSKIIEFDPITTENESFKVYKAIPHQNGPFWAILVPLKKHCYMIVFIEISAPGTLWRLVTL